MNLKIVAVSIILFGVLSRLLPHHPNFVPISALSLFAGAYLPKRFVFLPLLALLISDYFIGFYGTDMIYVYGSFGLIALVGLWLRARKKPLFVIGSALFSSILFFLITNFGVWAPPNNWYPHNFAGLMQSYTMAIPFFRNTLLGDLGYTVLLFGGYELVRILGKKYLAKEVFNLVF